MNSVLSTFCTRSFLKKQALFWSIIFSLVTTDLLVKYKMEEWLVRPYQKQQLAENETLFSLYPEQALFVVKEVPLWKDNQVFNWSSVYVRNFHVGFSFLSFLERYFSRATVTAIIKLLQVSVLLFFLIFFYYHRMQLLLPIAFIVGGGFGNVLNRFLEGYVIDFIKWSFPFSSLPLLNPWPIFNLADVYISIGALLYLLHTFSFFSKTSPAGDDTAG